MTNVSTIRSIPEPIATLDLEKVRQKILDHDAKEAQKRNGSKLWTESLSVDAVEGYRQFLSLMVWYPKMQIVPSWAIDEVWHFHILNTQRYFKDCKLVFGDYRHHFPTFRESREVLESHEQARVETMKLFETEFGRVPDSYDIPYSDSAGSCYGCCWRGNK